MPSQERAARGAFMQIGEVATLTNLSLRTIRHYEEVGLVVPSGRTQGGFRLYVQGDVERLRLVRRMKRLFTLDEMRDLLEVMEAVRSDEERTAEEQERLLDRLRMYREAVLVQVESLQEQVDQAQGFAEQLGDIVGT